MYCPFCHFKKTRVIDKRTHKNGLVNRRRRVCTSCGKRFTTYEELLSNKIMVVKKDKRKQFFSRDKLFEGMMKACEKRNISKDVINNAVDRVEAELLKSGRLEVHSSELGGMVMRELKLIDNVAYLRFASVYKEFKDLTYFEKELKKLKSGEVLT
jgi:transcriptional repressor NrdR